MTNKAKRPKIIIDQEFKNLIPPLLPDEYKQLEANIVRDGCHEPLSVWQVNGKAILLDGHNREVICTKHGLPFETKSLIFTDRKHAKLWTSERQLGRRNLTDDQRAIVANEVREIRAAIAVAKKLKRARNIKAGYSMGAKTSSKGQTRIRAKVAAKSKLPERKLRLAQEIKKADRDVYGMVRSGKISLVEGRRLTGLPEVIVLSGKWWTTTQSCSCGSSRHSLSDVSRLSRHGDSNTGHPSCGTKVYITWATTTRYGTSCCSSAREATAHPTYQSACHQW